MVTTIVNLPTSDNGEGKPLYHYTDVKGLMGIIDKNSIWATHYQYLNDKSELNHAFELLKPTETRSNYNLESLLKMHEVQRLTILEDQNIFIVSFSKNRDQLSQWRGYTPLGGYTIGFKQNPFFSCLDKITKKLEENKLMFYFTAGECNYNSEDLLSLKNKYIDYLVYCYEIASNHQKNKEGRSKELRTKNPDLFLWFYKEFLTLIFRQKHETFKEEKEYRAVLLSDSDDLLNIPEIKYRPRAIDSLLIPYFDLPLSSDLNEIKEIIIGPCQHPELAEKSLRGFLDSHGLTPDKVDIDHSKIPYRAM